METLRVNEEIFLNRHSKGKNSETITQVKTRLPREKKILIVLFCFVLFCFVFLILAPVKSNNILITTGIILFFF